MRTFFFALILIGNASAQSIVGDNWLIDPEAYEEIVIESIDSEVQKYKLPKSEIVFSANFNSPGAYKFEERKNYRALLKDLRNKRSRAFAMNKNLSWENKVLKEQQIPASDLMVK